MFHICHNEYHTGCHNECHNEYCYYIIDISPDLLIKDLIEEINKKHKIKEKFKLYKKNNNKKLEELGETNKLSKYLYDIIYMY